MPAPRRRNDQRRTHGGARSAGDVWRTPDPLPDVEPMARPNDVPALLRSLGDVPAIGGNAKLGDYFVAVVERAAVIAVALATSADLISDGAGD